MTLVLLIADAVFTAAAGAAMVGLVTTHLRFLERALLAIVIGILAASAMTFALALLAGLSVATVLGGPALVLAAALGVGVWTGNAWPHWLQSWREMRTGWAVRPPVVAVAAASLLALAVAALFAHTISSAGADLTAGYPTVWADWSQHLTTQASFAVAGNLPPQNPLFSGQALLYPFLPDFQSAGLVVLGLSPGAALALPGAVLFMVIALLVICLARRLGLGSGAGMVAAAICFLGGGLGFVGAFGDACVNHGFAAAQCSLPYAISHPLTGVQEVAGTLHDLPGVIAAQPRAYDGLPSDGGPAPLPNMQWYTPLMAWWLPQRTILYGFAAALCVLVLLFAALPESRRGWAAFAMAGLTLGLLPLVHIQTLIALAIILLVVAVRHRRREWLALLGVALLLAGPRLAQVALGPHGAVVSGNEYPWIEPGWLSAAPATRIDVSFVGALQGFGLGVAQLVNPVWWGFWLINVGVVLPLCVVVVFAALAARFGPSGWRSVARRVTGVFPAHLLELFMGAMLVFALCNVVVFQSWDWDNTKLLVYWYMAVALLVGALCAHWWRRWWRGLLAVALPTSMLLTGALVVLRLLPWTPAEDSINGPFVIASAQERSLAAAVAATTAPGAVFLTSGRPNDPLLAVAGRTGLMGYYGWLWSYGTNFGARYGDEQTMYAGCTATPQSCTVPSLLREYHISYVEVDDRTSDPGAMRVDVSWWAAQAYPVIARSDHITVYDVRAVS